MTRYRWDPVYPMGRRDMTDASMRASDDERNAVADKLSRHYAEGRLDETEFKDRLDHAMSATTRGDLNGLFHDLPAAPERATTSAAPASPHRPGAVRGRLPCAGGRRHDALLSDVPRAVVPVRRRRVLPVAALQRAPSSPPSSATRRRRFRAELGDGPLTVTTHTPPRSTDDDPTVGLRELSALLGPAHSTSSTRSRRPVTCARPTPGK